MVLSLLYGKKYPKSQFLNPVSHSSILTFDTMVTEEHKFSSKVTYYPVENGTIVSDHILNLPDVVVLSGLITDTPLSIFAPFNRSISAFNSLIQLHEQRAVIDIITGIRIYRNMAITSIDVPRTVKTGQTLTFNIELQRIIYDDDVQVPLDAGNVFSGVVDNTPRAIVAQNSSYPILQNDPAYSLQDQASTSVNVGVQTLEPVPNSVLPNVLTNALAIVGA